MAKFYAFQVIFGHITIDKVPEKYRDEVIKILESYNKERDDLN